MGDRADGYSFKIRYRPGQQNGNADALSRLPAAQPDAVHVSGLLPLSSGTDLEEEVGVLDPTQHWGIDDEPLVHTLWPIFAAGADPDTIMTENEGDNGEPAEEEVRSMMGETVEEEVRADPAMETPAQFTIGDLREIRDSGTNNKVGQVAQALKFPMPTARRPIPQYKEPELEVEDTIDLTNEPPCAVCNKHGDEENTIMCTDCRRLFHGTCVKLRVTEYFTVQGLPWRNGCRSHPWPRHSP